MLVVLLSFCDRVTSGMGNPRLTIRSSERKKQKRSKGGVIVHDVVNRQLEKRNLLCETNLVRNYAAMRLHEVDLTPSLLRGGTSVLAREAVVDRIEVDVAIDIVALKVRIPCQTNPSLNGTCWNTFNAIA